MLWNANERTKATSRQTKYIDYSDETDKWMQRIKKKFRRGAIENLNIGNWQVRVAQDTWHV